MSEQDVSEIKYLREKAKELEEENRELVNRLQLFILKYSIIEPLKQGNFEQYVSAPVPDVNEGHF